MRHKNSTFLHDIKEFVLKAPSGKKQILAIFGFLKLFFNRKDFNGCWCINTISEIPKGDEKIRKEIKAQKEQFLSFIEDLVNFNFPKKNKKERQSLTKSIYVLYESAVSESHLHQEMWPIETANEICKKIIS